MRIAFACDHAGFDEPGPNYKDAIIAALREAGAEVIDCGTNGPESVDYPDFAERATRAVLNGEADWGVLLCGTGIGMSIAANRHPGIRAAVCATSDMARLAREHNDANVLCLGRRIVSLDECLALIRAWIETPFSGSERHQRRIDKMG